MQSCSALVETFESVEVWGKGPTSAFASLQFVSSRRDLGIIEDAGTDEGLGDCPSGRVLEGATEMIARERGRRGEPPVPVRAIEASAREAGAEGGAGFGWPPVAEGAGLAHDAGNLLGALGLYAELLALPGVLSEEFREYAEDLRLLSERSSAMIARLIEGARSQRAEECELTSLPGVMARCRGLLTRVARRSVEVELGPGADWLVHVPAEVVERIVTNLVKNAAEAMGDGPGAIVVIVRGAKDGAEPRVVLTVADFGCGLTEARLGSLGNSAVVREDGRGLGFRVVRELAAMSDGCVAVESAPGEGTRVSVEWRAIEQVEVAGRDGARRVLRGEAGWIAC